MKLYHYIFIHFVAILMVACSTSSIEEYGDLLATSDNLITFSSNVEQTKAAITDLTALKADGEFYVTAFVEVDNGGLTHYFDTKVLYESDSWSSEGEYYWPVSNALTLYSYAPIVESVVMSDTKDSFTYSCPSKIENQIDLLVDSLTGQMGSDSAVEITFAHVLSCIEFEVQFEDQTDVTLNAITINYIGIENIGQFSFDSMMWLEAQSPSYFDETSGFSTTISVDTRKTTTDSDTDPIIFNDIKEKLMIIPQAISSSTEDSHFLSVQLSYQIGDSEDITTSSVIELPAPVVNSVTQNEYKMGELYSYILGVRS